MIERHDHRQDLKGTGKGWCFFRSQGERVPL
jgi:hypothetical protein